MDSSQEINELALALSKAQAEFKPAVFDKVNPHFRSKYASHSSVMDACRSSLAKNGLSVIQGVIAQGEGRCLETKLMHSSGQWISSVTPLLVDKGNMQGLGSAITYARRYALSAILNVVADEDDDGNAAVETYKAPEKNYEPKGAVDAASNGKVLVTALVTREEKDKAKGLGFRWNAAVQKWQKWMTEQDLENAIFDFEIKAEV